MLTSISPRPLRLALAFAAALTIAACSKADQTAGTDFGAHSPRWISRFGDATRQA